MVNDHLAELDIHVVRKGTHHPVGILESLNDDGTATVRWGVADGHVYRDDISQTEIWVIRRN